MPSSTALQPALSVLIASKNRGDSVDRALRSIRAQDFAEPIEIIVVDDGSTPAITPADRDVNLVRNDINRGACASRNQGIALARGEFIALFDDDIELADPAVLRRALELARRHPDVAAIGFRHLQPNGQPHFEQPANSDKNCETAYFYGYGVLFRRAALEQIDGFEPTFKYGYEEQDLSLQLHRLGWRVMYSPELDVVHHNDSRERNVKGRRRLVWRNMIRTVLLRFPAIYVIPAASAKWLSFCVEAFRRDRADWSGGFSLALDTLKYLPHALRHRQPLTLRQIARVRQLHRHPQPLPEPPPA